MKLDNILLEVFDYNINLLDIQHKLEYGFDGYNFTHLYIRNHRLAGINKNKTIPFSYPFDLNDDEVNEWLNNNGTYLKVGKFFKAFCNAFDIEINDAGISTLVDKFNYILNKDSLQIKITDDIASVYDMIHSSSGTIKDSCMRNRGDYFYHLQNIAPVKIAYLKDGDILLGRALIWETSEDIAVMDRIYFANNAILETFKAYAKKQGFWHKKEQNYHNKTEWVKPDGKTVEHYFTIDLNDIDTSSLFPYLDTFTFINSEDLYLTNDVDDDDCDFEAVSTVGALDERYIDICSHCDRHIYPSEPTYDSFDSVICEDCANDEFAWSEIQDTYIPYNDAIYIEDLTDFDLEGNASNYYYTEDTNKYFDSDDYLYYAEDNGLYYEYGDLLYYTEDCVYIYDLDNGYILENIDNDETLYFYDEDNLLFHINEQDLEIVEEYNNTYEVKFKNKEEVAV